MKSYSETIHWLFEQFPAYQNIGKEAYKPTLEHTYSLLNLLGNPHKNLRFIHVAGTNGKGSTCHILSSIFQEHKLKTGLFTSPHLLDFRERIKVNGVEAKEQFVIDFTENIKNLKLAFSPSFFEISFTMAMAYFAQQECDICVIETGLGGRLDATNVITPLLSIITNIGFDHQQFLGNTLTEIATEKAGIIKQNVPVLIAERKLETKAVFEQKAKEMQSPLFWVDNTNEIPTDLSGKYQKKNVATAYSTFKILANTLGLNVSTTEIAISKVQTNCPIKGRMQLLQRSPMVIVDAAHNEAGIIALFESVGEIEYENLHIVYGASSDKAVAQLVDLFPKDAFLYFTVFNNKRSSTLETLEVKTLLLKQNKTYYTSPDLAYHQALKSAHQNDLILIFGSFFLIENFL